MMKIILSIFMLSYLMICLLNGDEEISDPPPISQLCIKFGEYGQSECNPTKCQFNYNENNGRYQWGDYHFYEPAELRDKVYKPNSITGRDDQVGLIIYIKNGQC